MVAELFGIRSHGLLFGIVICLSSIGGALGPIVTGRIFDTTSSYKIAFLLLLVLATIALVLAVLLRQIKPKKNISVTA
jgi:MFS family permease